MKTPWKIRIACLQLLLVLGLLLATQTTVKADQLEEAMAAYNEGIAAHSAGNYQKALEIFQLLAGQGHAIAQNNLGVMYRDGQGTPQNYKEAIKWFYEAAEQGSADAQLGLGLMYANGQGTTQDYVHAHKWFNLSASRSQGKTREKAVKNRDLAETKLMPTQVEVAQQLAREWKPKTWKELSQQN